MIALRSGVGCQISVTASQIVLAKPSSVAVKVSGLYSKRQSVLGCEAASSRISRAAVAAISTMPSVSLRKTTRRNSGDVAL